MAGVRTVDSEAAKTSFTAPATVVVRQFAESHEFGLQRSGERAVARDAALDGGLAAADPLHDLDLAGGRDLVRAGFEIAFLTDEKGGLSGVAVRQLHHQVLAEAARRAPQSW